MTSPTALKSNFMNALDLVVDLATLGEYGVEPVPATPDACTGRRCEQDGHFAAWEALVTPRRGACATRARRDSQQLTARR